MTSDQITTLAVSEKSETLEFKETTGTRREAAVAVCAFLNQCGGQVLELPFKALLHKLMTGEVPVSELNSGDCLFPMFSRSQHGD